MEIQEITKEMYEALKKPMPTEAVKPHPTKTYLSSIKAIFVTERLNDVFGCGSWQIHAEKTQEGKKGMIVVKTTLTIPKYGVYYESFGGNDNGGENSKNFDLGDAYKGATTDGITKIGSYLGIGIEVFKGHGNTAPKQEAKKEVPKVDQLQDAIKEFKACTTNEDAVNCWSKWKTYQSNPDFIKEKDSAKARFSENKPPLNTVEDNALTAAIIEMADCKSLADGTKVFNKYPKYQAEKLFTDEHAKIMNKFKTTAQ